MLFRTKGFFGEVVVDFLDRHPAAAAAETNERTVAVARVLLAGVVYHGGAGLFGFFAEILVGGVRTNLVGLIVLPVGLRQLFPFEPLFLERFLLVEVDVGIKSVVTRLHQSIILLIQTRRMRCRVRPFDGVFSAWQRGTREKSAFGGPVRIRRPPCVS